MGVGAEQGMNVWSHFTEGGDGALYKSRVGPPYLGRGVTMELSCMLPNCIGDPPVSRQSENNSPPLFLRNAVGTKTIEKCSEGCHAEGRAVNR